MGTVNNGRFLTLRDYRHDGTPLAYGLSRYTGCLIDAAATGLHDGQGRPIVETYVKRDSGACLEFPFGKPAAIGEPVVRSLRHLDTVVFIPRVDFDHFGHLLTETAGWLAPFLDPEIDGLRQAGPKAVVVLGDASEQDVDRVRGLFGLPDRRVMSTRSFDGPHRCNAVCVAKPTCVNRAAIHERHFHAVRQLVNRLYGINPEMEQRLMGIETSSVKTYLSRSRLPEGFRQMPGESRLEEALAANGWQVVHPETLPMAEQLAILKRSAVVAGHIGSAFHLLMYFGTNVEDKIVIGLGLANGRLNANFSNQFHRQAVHFLHLCCLRHVRFGDDETRLTLPAEAISRKLEAMTVRT